MCASAHALIHIHKTCRSICREHLCKQLHRCDCHFLDLTRFNSLSFRLRCMIFGGCSVQVWNCKRAMNKIINETSFSTKSYAMPLSSYFQIKKFPHWCCLCKHKTLHVIVVVASWAGAYSCHRSHPHSTTSSRSSSYCLVLCHYKQLKK